MIFRILAVGIAILAGVAVASLSPTVSTTVRSVAAALGLSDAGPGRSVQGSGNTLPERESPTRSGGQRSAPQQTSNDVLKLSPERIATARIETAPAKPVQLSRHIAVPGTIVPAGDRITRVPARVVGTVAELRKRLGDPVTRGEVVAILDSREVADVRGDFLTASVNLELQRTAFERTRILWEKRITSEQLFLQARATFQEAQLRLDLARQKLLALGLDANEVAEAAQAEATNQTTSRLRQYPIQAGGDGRVVERRVDVGASMGQQNDPTEIYTIVDLSVVWLELSVAMTDIGALNPGQKVTITTGADQSSRAEGKLSFVSPLLDRDTRQARVVAEISNADEALRPGMFVTAEIGIGNDTAVVAVPRTAIQTVSAESVVFVRIPEGFQKRAVTLGRSDDRSVEVTAGLAAGEMVAVVNSFALKAELGRSQTDD